MQRNDLFSKFAISKLCKSNIKTDLERCRFSRVGPLPTTSGRKLEWHCQTPASSAW